MKLYKFSTYIKAVLVLVTLLLFTLWIQRESRRTKIIHFDEMDIENIKKSLELYIHQNIGQFPSSKDDMILKGFLKVSQEGQNEKYSLRVYPKADVWVDGINIEKYFIRYGFNIGTVDILDDKLYDKINRSQVLLIDCPFAKENWREKRLRKTCENATYELYQKIIRRQETLKKL